MTLQEMMRLQGWLGPFTQTTTDAQLGQMLGNSMSVNVLQRLLCRLLPAAGLCPASLLLPDHWEAAAVAEAAAAAQAAEA